MEKKIYREDLLQMLNVKEQTLKEIIKKKKLAERLERLGFTYLRTEKEGRKSVYIVEEKSNSENISTWNGLLKNYFGIKESNGEKFANYLMYRFMNINNPISKSMIAEKVGINKNTITKWDKKLMDLELLKKVATFYIEKVQISDEEVCYDLVDEETNKEFWSERGYVNAKRNLRNATLDRKINKQIKHEDCKYEEKILKALDDLMCTKEFTDKEDDVRDRFVFPIDKFELTGENGKASETLKDVLQLAREMYDINVDKCYIEWKSVKDLIK